ncbi:Checkpoint protein hus1 [Diatrype stigma]|uniref:Checkpoint protein hus1 n=1 Tax=Diatrype stigma TaxID=117547 RepID=A0AAN9V3E0_9PEZI
MTLFTHIAAFMDEDGIDARDHPRLDLDCTICGEYKLEMPPHASMFSPDDQDAYFQVEPFAVVPCGHIFGYHCLSKWAWEEITDSKPPTCPICRLKLVHPGCGHLVRIQPYNVRASRRSQLPGTIHEGGSLNDFCEQCEHEIFEEVLQEIQMAVYPHEPNGLYRDPRTDGADRTDQLRRDMAAYLQRLRRENTARMLRW